MFKPNKESLKNEISNAGNALKESGAFEVTIKKMVEINARDSKAEGYRLELETESGDARITLFYKDSKGKTEGLMKLNENKLNWLFYLLKEKDLFVSTEVENQWGFNELVCEKAEGKVIGAFIDYQGGEEKENNGKIYVEYKYNLEGFYDPETFKTAHEIAENKEALKFNELTNKYAKSNEKEKEIKKIEKKSQNFSGIQEDEFPF